MFRQRAPWLTLAFLATCLSSMFICHWHDHKQWQIIHAEFTGSLMPEELDRYKAYLQREQKLYGSSPYTTYSLKAINNNQNTPLDISKLILLDKKYYAYVLRDGHLIIDPWTLAAWKETREQLEQGVEELNQRQLSVGKPLFRIAAIPGHAFVGSYSGPYGMEILIYLIPCLLALLILEASVSKLKILSYLFAFLAFESTIYYLITDSLAQHLNGLMGLMIALSSYAIFSSVQRRPLSELSKFEKIILLSISICVVSALGLSYLLNGTLSWPVLLSAIASSAIMLGLVKLNRYIESQQRKTKTTLMPIENWDYRSEFGKAMDFISRFEFTSARQVLRSLEDQYPESTAILEQRYYLSKLLPDDDVYWKCAEKLVDLSMQQQDHERMRRLFKDIQKSAQNKKRAATFLKPEYYHKMMMQFISHNDLNHAEKAFHFLELNASINLKKDACQLLIDKFKAQLNTQKQQQYEMLLQRLT